MTTIKYFSMFTGIGGFEYGIERVNLRQATEREICKQGDSADNQVNEGQQQSIFSAHCVGYSEIDKHATAIFRYHYSHLKNYGNAREINPMELPDFDILCGGFPCQSFSIAGKRAGFEDTRGTLFHEICRIAQSKRPRILFLENVLGLLSADDGRCFATILTSLDELGYDVEWQVLDSQNFGVPQHRERVFIIGHLRGQSSRQIFPIGERGSEPKAKPASTIGTREGNRKENNFIVLQPSIDILGNIYPSQHQAGNIYSPEGIVPTLKCEGVRPNAKNQAPKILDVSHIGHEGVREYDETCPSLNTVGGGGHLPLVANIMLRDGRDNRSCLRAGRNLEVGYEYHSIRRLTPIECERLQAFPDDWTKYGIDEKGKQYIVSDSQRYKCLGNAVTTKVITAIAKKLFEEFDATR